MDNVTFAVVDTATNVVGEGADSHNGLMGISFDIGEAGVESGILTRPYPGIISQLKKNKQINTRAYSLWLNDIKAVSGSILFGGVDKSKYTAPLLGLPIVGTNSSDYAKIDRLAVEFTGLSLQKEQPSLAAASSSRLSSTLARPQRCSLQISSKTYGTAPALSPTQPSKSPS